MKIMGNSRENSADIEKIDKMEFIQFPSTIFFFYSFLI